MINMEFNTYVINLEKDKENWIDILKTFKKHNIKPIRYDAIFGKNKEMIEKYDDRITSYCKKFCPYGVIGCGLSNLDLMKHIYKTDKNDYALICEDDINVREEVNNLKDEIKLLLDKSPNDWDIILLFCQGFCRYNSKELFTIVNNFMGSTACYLVNIKNLKKTLDIKLNKHIDMQLYSNKKLFSYIYNKQLFFTNDEISYNNSNGIKLYDGIRLNNMFNTTIDRTLDFKQFKIPVLDIELTSKHMYLVFLIIILLYLYRYKKYKAIASILIVGYCLPIILFVCLNNIIH